MTANLASGPTNHDVWTAPVTTSRTEEPIAPAPPVTVAARGDGGARSGPAVRRGLSAALLLLAALPAIAGLVDLWLDRGEPYFPYSDQAFLGLVVDDVGRHEVLLGAYSRFDWYHPGPMAAYLLAVPYHLLGEALQAFSVGALVINGSSMVVSVWLVRRRAGVLAAAWALVVLVMTVHVAAESFIRDAWNPYLPVLPFLAGTLLCWTAIRGDAWALPLAVVPLSLAAQSHIGFLPAVGAVGAVLAVGLLLRAVRHQRRRRAHRRSDDAPLPTGRPRRWAVAGVLALAIGVLLWTPPAVQQITGEPGNAGVLVDYLFNSSPAEPAGVGAGLRTVADEFGKLPATLTGSGPLQDELLPNGWPAPANAVGIVLFVGALAVAVARRRADALWLGAMTMATAAAGVAAVARIDGLTFPYLTKWTFVVGVLAWTTTGFSLLPEVSAAVGRTVGRFRRAPRPATLLGVPMAALVAVAVAVATMGSARAESPFTDVSGDYLALEQAIVADLERRGLGLGDEGPVVRVDFASTTRTEVLVGTLEPGPGVVLALHRDGVDVQVDDLWRISFGERYTERVDEAGYVATIAHSDGSSPPPEPWQQVLAVGPVYEVYGGVPPAG